MAITTDATISIGLSWTQTAIDVYTTLTDAGAVSFSTALQPGSGDVQTNLLWYDTRTLGSGSGETLDCHALTRTLFNDSYLMSFNGGYIKALVVNNLGTGLGTELELNFSTVDLTNPFNGPIGGGTGILQVPTQSALAMSHTHSGWPVNATQREMRINNVGGSGSTYEIALIGVSG